MASQVTQFYYLYDTPFQTGNDWEVVIVAPNSGNAEVSFDNGATWNQANQGYDATYGGFRYRPPCYGTLGCNPPVADGGLVLGRIVGETEVLKATFGQIEQNPGSTGWSLAYSAVCRGGSIFFNIISQYGSDNVNNYQLSQTDTQLEQLSVNGNPIGVNNQWVDSCPLSTCHWSQVYVPTSLPTSSFPATFVFSDSSSVVGSWTHSVTLGNLGDPCVVAPNPTADAVDDNVGTQGTGVATTVDVGTNDTACDIGTTTWQLIPGSEVNVTGVSLASGSTFNYTPIADGAFSFQYQILCNGVVLDQATVSGTSATACINVSGGTISGPTPVIPNANYVYSVTGLSGDAPFTYLWSGGTVVSGQGTDTATITITTATTISVTITNCGGSGSVTLSFPVTLQVATADAVDDNVGGVTVGISNNVIIGTNDTPCSFGVTTYTLIPGSESNVTIDNFPTSGSVNYTAIAAGAFSFQYNLLCDGIITDTATVSGTASPGCVNVTTTPVTGNASVFAGTPENYTATPDGTTPHTYVWTAVGGTINSGQGTATVNVTFTGSGSISVVVTNCVGAGTANGTLPITLITAVAVDDSVTTSIDTPVVIQMAANDTLCN